MAQQKDSASENTLKTSQSEEIETCKEIEFVEEVEIFLETGHGVKIPSQEFADVALEAMEEMITEDNYIDPIIDQWTITLCENIRKCRGGEYGCIALPIETNGKGTDSDGGFLELEGWTEIKDDEYYVESEDTQNDSQPEEIETYKKIKNFMFASVCIDTEDGVKIPSQEFVDEVISVIKDAYDEFEDTFFHGKDSNYTVTLGKNIRKCTDDDVFDAHVSVPIRDDDPYHMGESPSSACVWLDRNRRGQRR